MTAFSPEELQRYARHFSLNEIGIAGQEKLKKAKVLLVGAGGIGSPAAYYLAAAGIGTLGIVDDDRIDVSNLQRQILFSTDQVGQHKAEVARTRVMALNPHVQVNVYPVRLTAENAHDIIREYDVVIDGSDNYPTRYLVGDVCADLKKPLVASSIYQLTGQLSVFNYQEGPCYRCLYPSPPPAGLVPNCAQAGVLGVIAGILGTLAVNEVIKIVVGIGAPLSGCLATFDALNSDFKKYHVDRHAECPICVHHTLFKDLPHYAEAAPVCGTLAYALSALQLQALYQQPPVGLVVLDVREPWERELCKIDPSIHIPLGQVAGATLPFESTQPVVVYCKAGVRSAHAADILRQRGCVNVSHLDGGILAWIREVSPALTSY